MFDLDFSKSSPLETYEVRSDFLICLSDSPLLRPRGPPMCSCSAGLRHAPCVLHREALHKLQAGYCSPSPACSLYTACLGHLDASVLHTDSGIMGMSSRLLLHLHHW